MEAHHVYGDCSCRCPVQNCKVSFPDVCGRIGGCFQTESVLFWLPILATYCYSHKSDCCHFLPFSCDFPARWHEVPLMQIKYLTEKFLKDSGSLGLSFWIDAPWCTHGWRSSPWRLCQGFATPSSGSAAWCNHSFRSMQWVTWRPHRCEGSSSNMQQWFLNVLGTSLVLLMSVERFQLALTAATRYYSKCSQASTVFTAAKELRHSSHVPQ